LKHIRLWMILAVALGSVLVFACGGDSKDDTGDEPTTAAATSDGSSPTDDGSSPTDDGSSDNGDGAFGDIPVPDGADEIDSGTFSGAQFPVIDPSGSVDASTFSDIEYKTYETSDSAESVIEFYSDELSGWDEVYKFSAGSGDAGAGGFGIWTRNDGNQALWVTASEADGTTTVTVLLGSAA